MLLKFKEPVNKSFEITVAVRDANNESTGSRKTFSTNDGYQLWKFWERNRPSFKKKSKAAKKHSVIPDAKEADKILKNLYKDKDGKEIQDNGGDV